MCFQHKRSKCICFGLQALRESNHGTGDGASEWDELVEARELSGYLGQNRQGPVEKVKSSREWRGRRHGTQGGESQESVCGLGKEIGSVPR